MPSVRVHGIFGQLQELGGKRRGHEHVGSDPRVPFMLGQEA